ncbi:MAG: ABC transporter permease [bacterium]
MLKNYLKIALRNLLKHKGYSFINVAGLAIGMTCCVLILLFVQDELSYDRYHENASRIYRIVRIHNEDDTRSSARIGAPWAPALQNDYPEVSSFVRFRSCGRPLIGYLDKQFYEENGLFAESTLFEVFSFPLIKGDPKAALARPNTVVITETMAQKYFGDEDPIGKTLTLNSKSELQVTGVAKDPRRNSHFRFGFLISFATYNDWDLKEWNMNNFHAYLLLAQDHFAPAVEGKFPDFFATHLGAQAPSAFTVHLQPLTTIHLHSHLSGEFEANGDMAYVYIFSAIALFVLLIACVNFVNLATARSARRAQEVGLRKVVGAQRSQLVRQFLGESGLLSFLALFLTIGLVELFLPAFNSLSGKELRLDYGNNPVLALGLLGMALLVGIVAGAYPAFFLSSFRPAAVLKGMPKTGLSGSLLRKGLVVAQFAISVTLIIATGVVLRQLQYISGKKLGFNKEQVLVIRMQGETVRQKYESFRHELLQHPEVVGVAAASGKLGGGEWGTGFGYEGAQNNERLRASFLAVDHDYLETLQMKIVAGRDFSRNFATDASEAYIINETAARQFGWDDPIGKYIDRPIRNSDGNWGSQRGRVVGVVQDFHFRSLHETINPMVMFIQPSFFGSIYVRIQSSALSATMASLEQTWLAFEPSLPFDYSFLDAGFDRMYRAEQRLGKVFGTFSFLAIFVACLGLFGLASFTTEQRTKEIGVRKVLGATVSGIVLMISKEFTKLVLVAIVVATPIAYYLMNRWLQDFAYRTEVGWWVIASAGGLALVIALLTVSTQAIKAALANPVEALRYE